MNNEFNRQMGSDPETQTQRPVHGDNHGKTTRAPSHPVSSKQMGYVSPERDKDQPRQQMQ